jgi:hypothetical protein
MGKAIPAQHPAVVLRSHYKQLRALLAVAMIGVVGLTAAVVILATNEDRDTSVSSATQLSTPAPTGSIRYDGGPEEGTRGALSSSATATSVAGVRYDGGPEEGSRGGLLYSTPSNAVPGTRYDGGPEEGSRGSRH